MKRIKISELKKKIGRVISISGWVHSIRDQGKVKFIQLRDISGIVQCVYFEKEVKVLEVIKQLSLESVVEIEGFVKEEKQAPLGFEIQIISISILSKAEPQLPIPVVEKTEGETELPKRLDYRWLDLRKPKSRLIFEISSAVMRYMREYFQKEGFFEFSTPKLMATPSESKAELFKVKYFERDAYLAQSAQFYKQMAMASGFEKFYTFGDTYRMDPSSTIWHVAQFVQVDVEFSFIQGVEDVYKFEEKLIKYTLEMLKIKYGEKIKEVFSVELPKYGRSFPRISVVEAKKITKKMGYKSDSIEISSPEEKLIGEWAKKEFGSDFVFLTDFPVSLRPFYHMKKSKEITRSGDLIFKGRELSTDAQREHRYEILKQQAIDKELDPAKLQHYLDFFRWGCPPHGGFGFGFERFIMQILGLSNIREAVYLPRDMKRLTP